MYNRLIRYSDHQVEQINERIDRNGKHKTDNDNSGYKKSIFNIGHIPNKKSNKETNVAQQGDTGKEE